MNTRIALTLLLSAIAVSARSLQGYNCREYPVFSGDPSAPLRTVRVCGAMDYEAAPKYSQMGLRTEDAVRRSLPSHTLYGGNSAWPSPTFQSTLNSWPLSSQSYNNDEEQPSPFRGQSIPQSGYADETFNQIGSVSTNPFNNNNELRSQNPMEVERSLKQQLGSLVEDVSEVKDSIATLVPYVKNIVDILRLQSTLKENDENVNVNFKLDPSFEALLKQFLQLINSTTEKKEEQITPESMEDTEDNQEEKEEEEEKTEGNTTELPDSTTESSNEEDATEEVSAMAGDNSLENLESWLRLNFGPSIKAHTSDEEIEDIVNKTSEEENSPEKSDESFETWFNAVYRRVPTKSNNDYNSEENTQRSHDSKEVVQTESSENYDEDNLDDENEDETSKSSEASTENKRNTDNNNRNVGYEIYFVPTTTGPIQEDTTAEYLKNRDQYGYVTENSSNAKLKELMIHDCLRMALSMTTLDRRNLFNKYNKCVETLNESNKSKDNDDTKSVADSGSSESKESGETEPAITVFTTIASNELNESEENNYSEADEMKRPSYDY